VGFESQSARRGGEFSCHATTSPGGISANWPAAMEQTLRGATGHAALPVVFLQARAAT